MGAMKEYYLRIQESEYMDIPEHFRDRLAFKDVDYDIYRGNPEFEAAYTAYRKAKKKLDEVKFNIRHARNT